MESQRRKDTKHVVIDSEIELCASQVVNSCFYVHTRLGPGMLESIYEKALLKTFKKRGLDAVSQVPVPVEFDGEILDQGFRADIIVNGAILIELKACENLLPVHRAQTLSYLRFSKLPLAFLVNFNVPLIKNGMVRIINDRFAPLRLCDGSGE